MAQKKTMYRIWDNQDKEYITLGSYRKKHTWLVFPWEAIRENASFLNHYPDRFEVHQFDLTPSNKFNLKKELL